MQYTLEKLMEIGCYVLEDREHIDSLKQVAKHYDHFLITIYGHIFGTTDPLTRNAGQIYQFLQTDPDMVLWYTQNKELFDLPDVFHGG